MQRRKIFHTCKKKIWGQNGQIHNCCILHAEIYTVENLIVRFRIPQQTRYQTRVILPVLYAASSPWQHRFERTYPKPSRHSRPSPVERRSSGWWSRASHCRLPNHAPCWEPTPLMLKPINHHQLPLLPPLPQLPPLTQRWLLWELRESLSRQSPLIVMAGARRRTFPSVR